MSTVTQFNLPTGIAMRIDADSGLVADFLDGFGGKASAAIRRALKRTLTGMRKAGYEEARREYNIRYADVQKAFVSNIWGTPPVAQGTFSGSRIKLMRFDPRPASITRKRPPVGVSVLVKDQRKPIRGSFIARMRSGHIGVFQRTGAFGRKNPKTGKDDWRLEKIDELEGPALAQMLNNPLVSERIQERSRERFDKELRHEIDFVLKGGLRQ